MAASTATDALGEALSLTLDQKIAALVDDIGPIRTELQTTLRTLRLAKDYDAVLNQLSGASLVLMRQIFQAAGLTEPSDNACDCIEAAHKAKLLEPEFYSSLHHIRVWSNRVDHRRLSIKPSEELAEGQLAAFLLVVEWFFTESEQNPQPLDTIYSYEAATPALLAPYEVSPTRRQRLERVFVTPPGYDLTAKFLDDKRLLWILGPPGVGKRTLALALALRYAPAPVYDLPNTIRCTDIRDTGVAHAVVVLPDVLDTERFDDEGFGRDWYHLEALVKRGNRLILTTSEERYLAVRAELVEQLDSQAYGECRLDRTSFRLEDRETLYRTAVSDSAGAGILSNHQQELALALLESGTVSAALRPAAEQLRHNLADAWTPRDIRDFVCLILPTIERRDDVSALLRQGTQLDSAVHEWFVALAPAEQCFVFTLTLCQGLSLAEIWQRHKEIITALRPFDPLLCAPPLGILRSRLRPFVDADGPLRFVDQDRVVRAVIAEIALNYREYVLELMPKFVAWSVPNLPRNAPPDEVDRLLLATRDMRVALARLAGAMGRYSVAGVRPLLEVWAAHTDARIRIHVAASLQEAAQEPVAATEVLEVVHSWLDNTSSERVFLRWTAAASLSQVALLPARPQLRHEALKLLSRLAKDRVTLVRAAAASGYKHLAAKLPLQDIATPLARLAADEDEFPRKQAAAALDRAYARQRDAVLLLLETWSDSQAQTLPWTATYFLLIAGSFDLRQRVERLGALCQQCPADFLSAVRSALADQWHAGRALRVLTHMARLVRQELVQGLYAAQAGHARDLAALLQRFEAEGDEALRSIPAEVAHQDCATTTGSLSPFQIYLDTLRNNEIISTPEARDHVVHTLASAYRSNRLGGDEFCTILLATEVPSLAALVMDIRWQYFRALCDFPRPPVDFVIHLRENLDHEHLSENTVAVLTRFTENPTDLASVVTCLSTASLTYGDEVSWILRFLRPALPTLVASVEAIISRWYTRARMRRRAAMGIGGALLLFMLWRLLV